MLINMLKTKIHRAVVKQANLNYIGSITIDEILLDQSDIFEYEKVTIVNINNGNRFQTYVIKGEKHSGMICLNGAAARLVQEGDIIIIMCYCYLTIDEEKNHTPRVIFVNKDNTIKSIKKKKKHGQIKILY